MTKTMKAAVVHEFGKPLAIEEVPVPTPGPGELLIKIVANGVCHTDLHAAQGDWPAKPTPPFIPGHEGAGIVAAIGPGFAEYAIGSANYVAAVDVTEQKLALARASGAEVTANARSPDAVAQIVRQTCGGAHGALVTAVSPPAFGQAIHMVRRKGTIALVGLPPGEFAMPIFDVVLNRITIRGSIVGGRQDLAEAIAFAAEGKVHSHYHEIRLEDINEVFSDMKAGKLDGRMVMTSF